MGRHAAAAVDAIERSDEQSDVASSVTDAKAHKSQVLQLSSQHHPDLSELRKLQHLRTLDLHGTQLPKALDLASVLPDQLTVLHVTGCGLDALPPGLTRLRALKHLYAGANAIKDITGALALPQLELLGCSYNPIATLPSAHSMQQAKQLLSLDLRHCDLADLPGALASLAALPALQVLSLMGNPFCLLPTFGQQSRGLWSRTLVFLDGKRIDNGSSSRPGTARGSLLAASAPNEPALLPDMPPAATPALDADAAVLLSIALGPLEVFEEPAATVPMSPPQAAAAPGAPGQPAAPVETPPPQPAAAAAAAAASAVAAAAAAVNPAGSTSTAPAPVVAPPQACYWHYELEGCDGESSMLEAASSLCPWTTTQISDVALASLVLQPHDQDPTDEAPSNDGASPDQTEPSAEDGESDIASSLPCQATKTTLTLKPPRVPDALATTNQFADALGPLATLYASIPFKVLPRPTTPAPVEAASTAAKGVAKKEAAKPAGKAAAGSKPGTPLPAAQELQPKVLQRGSLAICVPLAATVQGRDWLRQGVHLRLYRTRLTAVPKPNAPQALDVPPPTPTPPSKGNKGGGKSKVTEDKPAPILDAFDLVPETQLVAEGRLAAASGLLSGTQSMATEVVSFVPVRQLWDDKGHRMPLKDSRHSSSPIAQLTASVSIMPTA